MISRRYGRRISRPFSQCFFSKYLNEYIWEVLHGYIIYVKENKIKFWYLIPACILQSNLMFGFKSIKSYGSIGNDCVWFKVLLNCKYLLLLAAAKGMYSHHRYLKSPFLRSKKSQEEAQLLPEVGLARKHTRNMDDGVAMVSFRHSQQYNFRVHGSNI